MMRTLFLTSTLQRSGPVVVLHNIIKYLDQSQVEPIILTLSPEPADSMWPLFEQTGTRIHSLGLSRAQGAIQGPWLLQRSVKDLAPDVVQSQGIRSDILAAAVLGGWMRVALLHNYAYADYSMTYGAATGKLMASAHLSALRRVNKVVACSGDVAHRVSIHGLNDVQVILNGVDTRSFQPPTETRRNALRQQLQIPDDQHVVLFVGQLSERKDPQTILRGFLAAEFSRPTSLFLVGDGPLMQQCLELGQANPHIRFAGRVTNVLDYLQAADCFVSASRAEGLPNAVLEALACGLPVCLSNIAPHQEFFAFGVDIGVQFQSGDASSLAQSLSILLADKDRSRQDGILDLVQRHLSAEQMARQYQSLYQTLV